MSEQSTGTLVLVRHGQSQWNAKGLWTGWTDIPLSNKGIEEARSVGEKLQNIHFDYGYTSNLTRAQQTMEEIRSVLHQSFPVTKSEKLNERNYGIYTGKNKWDIEKQLGEEKFLQLRRSWDYPIEQGESLKQVYDRVIPYFTAEILPKLEAGKHVLIAAHGNSLRTIIKFMEHIADEEISHVELATGEALLFQIGQKGNVISIKSIRTSGTVA